MSNNEYTPSRQELIAAWIEAHQEDGWGGPVDKGGRPKERIAEAHRGVAEVWRAASEKAYDEGVSDFMQAHDRDNFEPWMYLRDNPYRRKDS